MQPKTLAFLLMSVGTGVGSWLPTLFGAGFLSLWSVFFGAVGGLIGIWAAVSLSDWLS